MERKLAKIVYVDNVEKHFNADSLDICTIGGWKVVTKRDEFKPGDFAVYFEVDSFLPIEPEFEFLRKSSYKKMGDQEGFRLRTVKLRGQISQGLLLPISILENEDEIKIGYSDQPWGKQLQVGPYDNAILIQEGEDVTDYLGIESYKIKINSYMKENIKKIGKGFLNVVLTISAICFGLQVISWGTQLLNQPYNLLVFAGVIVCLIGIGMIGLTFNEIVKFVLIQLSNKQENN